MRNKLFLSVFFALLTIQPVFSAKIFEKFNFIKSPELKYLIGISALAGGFPALSELSNNYNKKTVKRLEFDLKYKKNRLEAEKSISKFCKDRLKEQEPDYEISRIKMDVAACIYLSTGFCLFLKCISK